MSAPENPSVTVATDAKSSSTCGLPCVCKRADHGTWRRHRGRHEQHAVESARPAKRRIKMPRGVGSRQDQHAFVRRVDAVHLAEKLVDRMAHRGGAEVGSARGQRIDFVEEQDARLVAPPPARRGRAGSSRCCPSTCREYRAEADDNEARLHFPRGGRGPECVLPAAGRAEH